MMTEIHSMRGELRHDPLECLGALCGSIVLGFLSPHDLSRCAAVCQHWQKAVLQDERLWEPHLASLWTGKVYVPDALRALALESPRRAYAASLADATRQVPTEAELCRFTWSLRFKAVSWFSASMRILNLRRYYHPNHTITAPPGDPLWGDVEPQRHYWYFRPGPRGDTVLQVNTYPFLQCTRTPDWGWELQNAVVRLTIDVAAGPNPGLPRSHPAYGEILSLEQIEARFNMLLQLQDLDSDDDDDDDNDGDDDNGAGGEAEDDDDDDDEDYGDGDGDGDDRDDAGDGDGDGLGLESSAAEEQPDEELGSEEQQEEDMMTEEDEAEEKEEEEEEEGGASQPTAISPWEWFFGGGGQAEQEQEELDEEAEREWPTGCVGEGGRQDWGEAGEEQEDPGLGPEVAEAIDQEDGAWHEGVLDDNEGAAEEADDLDGAGADYSDGYSDDW